MASEFEDKSLLIIEEYVEIIREVERAIFTNRYNLSEKHFNIFATNSISILYAIWEGCVQKLFGVYIDDINKEEVELFSLSNNLIIFCKERTFRQLKEYPKKAGQKISYIKKMKDFYSQDIHEVPRIIDTESNIGLEVLNRLLKQFNIEEYPEYWEDYKYPNPNLKESLSMFLRLRNTVAHGAELLPDEAIDHGMYERFKKLVLDLMYDLRSRMLNSLNSQTYKNIS